MTDGDRWIGVEIEDRIKIGAVSGIWGIWVVHWLEGQGLEDGGW